MPQMSKALVQPYRKNMLTIGAGWRALFSPLDYNAAQLTPGGGARVLDLQNEGPFDTNNPPAGFADLGWITGFKETPGEKIGQIQSGFLGAVKTQWRSQIGDQFEFQFREFGRLQYKVASGNQVFNLLASAGPASTVGPLSASGTTAVAMGASGYVVSGAVAGYAGQPTLYVPTGSGAQFPAGSLVVCDEDFTPNSTGLVGSNGALLLATGVQDVDYVRKTSDFVVRVAAVVANAASGQDALILAHPFLGGGSPVGTLNTPPASSKVQKVVGWTTRQGGSFITEWSGLFLADTVDGSQLAIFAPHLSIAQNKGITEWKLENAGQTDQTGYAWDVAFTALAFDDPLDGNPVCAYSALYPNARLMDTY